MAQLAAPGWNISHFMAGWARFSRVSPGFVPAESVAGPLTLPLVRLPSRAWLQAEDTLCFPRLGDLFIVNVLNCRLYFVLSLS